MLKLVQAKQISDALVLQKIDRIKSEFGRWTHLRELVEELGFPEKVVRAKVRSMIIRDIINGCSCGCRGDFERKAQ